MPTTGAGQVKTGRSGRRLVKQTNDIDQEMMVKGRNMGINEVRKLLPRIIRSLQRMIIMQ